MSFFRALVEGLGFGAGVEAVREVVRSAKDDAPAPVETPEQRAARVERELRAAEQAHAAALKQAELARKARAEKAASDAREVESELAALKRKLGK